jgi:signal transduction histidine kinase
MTIIRRIGVAYAWMTAACIALVSWLAWHEFVEEPREFAELGAPEIHKDTLAEFSTVCFLAAVPALLGFGWWWMRKVLSPLEALCEAVNRADPHHLPQPMARSMNGDEVDKLAAGFNSMTARLHESFRRIHEFTLHASHELKTPLTVMRGQLETLLRENHSPSSEQAEWIDSQLDEIKRLAHIVDSLTLLTKADAGLVKLEVEIVELSDLVQEAYEDAQVLAKPRDVQFSLEECQPARVRGDRHRLRQLLLILTDNAVKYNFSGGTARLALRVSGETAELRVTNTTRPLAPGTLENAFERFARGSNAQGTEGCGLGLTIAEWIVQAHQGQIVLRAEPEGCVTVTVHLPLVSPISRARADSA